MAPSSSHSQHPAQPQNGGSGLCAWLERPVDIASLAAFRILFGLMMCAGSVRFLLNGWVDSFFLEPSFAFKYQGFEWVQALPAPWMHLAVGLLAVLALMVALGLFYRVAIVAFFLLFTYVELIDVTWYLNHYYLVSLLALLLCVLPAHRKWSLDAWRNPDLKVDRIPAWMLHLVQFQVACVYFFAALAKLGPDWLLHAQPLNIWLNSRVDTPFIGAWLDQWWVALVFSWAGFLNDLLVVPGLLWKKTRPYAYAMVVVFHLATGYLFNIGMFPWILIVSATILFHPSWPRRPLRWLAARLGGDGPALKPGNARLSLQKQVAAGAMVLAALWCAFHVVMPLRTHAYGGDVLWHEQGMRWSWRVMVREKNGHTTYRVTLPDGRQTLVFPSRYLTSEQEREMSGQPDLILQLAHHIGEEYRAEYGGEVEVRVDSWASLNGRPPARLIAPDVDLMEVADGIAPAEWILPIPDQSPIRLQRASR